MPIKDFIERKWMTPARRERIAYMRSIPVRRLSMLLGATCLLFTATGLLNALSGAGPKWPATAILLALYSGFFGGLYTLAATRRPVLLVGVIALQFLSAPVPRHAAVWMNGTQPGLSFEQATRLYVGVAAALIGLSFAFFLRFILTEGRYAIRAQTELALAHSIQKTLVPAIDMTVGGCAIYGISAPSDKVGGDLVDVVALPDGSVFAYLVDVAGHGLQAGILMGMLKTSVRTQLMNSASPSGLFETLNRVLPQVKEQHMYATCVALHLEPLAGGGCAVEFALAAHPAMLHLSASGEMRGRLTDEQFPVGLLPFATYRSQQVHAARGDLLIATTDGLLEVSGADGVEFGLNGLEAVMTTAVGLPLAAIGSRILAAAKAWGKQEDDQTLLLLRIL